MRSRSAVRGVPRFRSIGTARITNAERHFKPGRNYQLSERVIAILPYASRRAVQPGGTRQVESYSSTMHGPGRGMCKSLRVSRAASSQPLLRPKKAERGGSGGAVSGARPEAGAAGGGGGG